MANLNTKPTQKHLVDEVAFMLWEAVKQTYLNRHIPGPVPSQMLKAAKDLGAAYAKLNRGATFLELYSRIVEVQSHTRERPQFERGDVVVAKGVGRRTSEHDVGTVMSVSGQGTAEVRWKRAGTTYTDDVDNLELADTSASTWDAEVAAWHFAFWAEGSESNMKWAHEARIRVPAWKLHATMDGGEVEISWEDDGERESHRDDFTFNPPRAVEVLIIEPDRKEQARTTKLVKQLYPKAHITVVDNAMAAIGNIDTHKYDLVVSEVELLGAQDGVYVFEHVRRTQPQLAEHFVFFTSSTRARGKVLDKADAVRGADLRSAIFGSSGSSAGSHRSPPREESRTHSRREARSRACSSCGNLTPVEELDYYSRCATCQENARSGGSRQHDGDSDGSRQHDADEWWNAPPATHGTGSSRDSGYVYRWWPPMPDSGYREAQGGDQRDLEDCANAIKKAVASVQGVGRFGRDKVFISVAWDAFNRYMIDSGLGRPYQVWDLAFFKSKLLQLMRHDLIVLTRADLVGAMPPDLVVNSEVKDRGAVFHFVFDSVEYDREREQRRRAREDYDRTERERKRAEYDRQSSGYGGHTHGGGGHTHGYTPAGSPLEEARAALGFGPDVPLTESVIKARKKQLAREHHPDFGGSTAMMAMINDAADVLIASLRN